MKRLIWHAMFNIIIGQGMEIICFCLLVAISDSSLGSECDEEKQLVVDYYLNVKFCLSVLLSCYRL